MKNAWLIISHNEFGILQRLVASLDAEGSDIYVHFDRKAATLPQLKVEKGRLVILDRRIDVRWGSVSQIETELLLLETAAADGPYDHYHILSGTHLPLRDYADLEKFYAAHEGEEVMRFWDRDDGDADFKLRRYHFPVRNFKSANQFKRKICQLTWSAVIKVQKVLGIRHMKDEYFYKTDNWLSLSEKGCRFLLENKKRILKKYRWSFCGDEYFVATEIMKEDFKIADCQELLHVEFQGDTPRTFKVGDVSRLAETGCVWARKFTDAD